VDSLQEGHHPVGLIRLYFIIGLESREPRVVGGLIDLKRGTTLVALSRRKSNTALLLSLLESVGFVIKLENHYLYSLLLGTPYWGIRPIHRSFVVVPSLKAEEQQEERVRLALN